MASLWHWLIQKNKQNKLINNFAWTFSTLKWEAQFATLYWKVFVCLNFYSHSQLILSSHLLQVDVAFLSECCWKYSNCIAKHAQERW